MRRVTFGTSMYRVVTLLRLLMCCNLVCFLNDHQQM